MSQDQHLLTTTQFKWHTSDIERVLLAVSEVMAVPETATLVQVHGCYVTKSAGVTALPKSVKKTPNITWSDVTVKEVEAVLYMVYHDPCKPNLFRAFSGTDIHGFVSRTPGVYSFFKTHLETPVYNGPN